MPRPAFARTEQEQRELIPTIVHADADGACALVAAEIAALIRERAGDGRHAVLGLATGSTPVRLYRELIRLHRAEGLSFANVITFNLDEYHGLPHDHPESYRRFMREQLFAHVDLPEGQTHVPDGMVPRTEVFAWCRGYEEQIRAAGGIDIQVLGIGRTGHIGFNEPGSARDGRTRLVTLDALTRRDAARDFLGEAKVPRHAITMGVGTILDARRILLLAWGEAKAHVVAQAIEGPSTDALPASLLQRHASVQFHIDTAAAAGLTRVGRPWLVGPVDWSAEADRRRAVVWLAATVKKPVLKLLDEDYGEHGMADLLTAYGSAYKLNIEVFNTLQHSITGWPGGKPGADDTHRPERAAPSPKRVVVLCPEPSDDVLSMGGTIRRLQEQEHDVTIVYLTSGNLGVPDEDAAMAAELIAEFAEPTVAAEAQRGARRLKGIVRRTEARASLRGCGVSAEWIRFLDLPFYERGRYRQFEIGDEDVAALTTLLRQLEPHQIFATGHLGDPSSVASMCYRILRRSLEQTESDAWRRDCREWLYRSPDRPWDPAEIEMAVPLSPTELSQKIQAIYQHKSQRSQTPLSAGFHEAWQQAERQDRALATAYDSLGLAEYEAIEAFQRPTWR